MRVVIALDQVFLRTPDDSVWTTTSSAYSAWSRYLAVFSGVEVVTRIRQINEPPQGALLASGPRVQFLNVSPYHGLMGYISDWFELERQIQRVITRGPAYILRGGSQIAARVAARLRSSWDHYPYAMEVVGDPRAVFAKGVVNHPLRPILRSYLSRRLRRDCDKAATACYVTSKYLQHEYPCSGPMFGVSDVELPEHAFVQRSKEIRDESTIPLKLLFVGSLAQRYKGLHFLLRALATEPKGRFRLVVVGDGRERRNEESHAKRLLLEPAVKFLGALPSGGSVREQMDAADVFVLPSLTEGCPRVLIEAMARGLPAIASKVGGVPELLDPTALFEPGNVSAVVRKLEDVWTNRDWLRDMGQRNLLMSREFHERQLAPKRLLFLNEVIRATEEWNRA